MGRVGPNDFAPHVNGASFFLDAATQSFLQWECPALVKMADWPADSPDGDHLDFIT